MNKKVTLRAFLPVRAVCLVVFAIIGLGFSFLKSRNIDPVVLLSGNAVLFLLTEISYRLHVKSLKMANPNAFVRMVYSSLIIKMLVCLIAVFLYGWMSRSVNKGGILGSLILYIVYTFLEVSILTKFIKKTPNAQT
ncbi:MAG TPA: hypothetical protein VN616_01565 [Puia sp.]|nr:hypothetical protein [Puia sp.]